MRICLIGATHPCHNPRLLREADSLTLAGHEVRVIAPSFVPDLRDRDTRLMENRRWHLEVIDFCPDGVAGNLRAYSTRGARRVYEEIFNLTQQTSLVERAYVPALSAMKHAACAEPADWFIAHAHRALPVAAQAADRWNSKLGFDCEDLLALNGFDSPNIVGAIEKSYLPRCNYVSVPSKSSAEELVKTHTQLSPVVLYNVFPLSLVNGMLEPLQRSSRKTIRLYWFSQTIGPGRGIEDALKAASRLRCAVEVHLQGHWARDYERSITRMARELDVDLHYHPSVDPDDLVQMMDRFDVGLALEPLAKRNAALTQSNKIGSYLLAGLAVAATDTPGQREILEQVPAAGFLYPAGKADALASGLGRWIEDREALRTAQQAAWDAARNRFCWDIEKEKFFATLQS